jgi:hypothetical protein
MAIVDKKIVPQYALISESTAATNDLVAAVTGKKIRVLSYVLNAAGGANTITFKSASTAISGAMDVGDNVSLVADCASGLFETAKGEALNLTQSGATLVAGHLTYVLV